MKLSTQWKTVLTRRSGTSDEDPEMDLHAEPPQLGGSLAGQPLAVGRQHARQSVDQHDPHLREVDPAELERAAHSRLSCWGVRRWRLRRCLSSSAWRPRTSGGHRRPGRLPRWHEGHAAMSVDPRSSASCSQSSPCGSDALVASRADLVGHAMQPRSRQRRHQARRSVRVIRRTDGGEDPS
jgi:hypothetical protein